MTKRMERVSVEVIKSVSNSNKRIEIEATQHFIDCFIQRQKPDTGAQAPQAHGEKCKVD